MFVSSCTHTRATGRYLPWHHTVLGLPPDTGERTPTRMAGID